MAAMSITKAPFFNLAKAFPQTSPAAALSIRPSLKISRVCFTSASRYNESRSAEDSRADMAYDATKARPGEDDAKETVDKTKQRAREMKEKAKGYGNQAMEKAKEGTNRAADAAQSAKERAKDYASEAEEKAKKGANKAGETAQGAKEKAKDYAYDAEEKAKEGSQKAAETAQSAKERAKEYAHGTKEKAQEVKNKREEVAEKTADKAKEGTSKVVETVGEKAMETVRGVWGAAKETGHKIKETVLGPDRKDDGGNGHDRDGGWQRKDEEVPVEKRRKAGDAPHSNNDEREKH